MSLRADRAASPYLLNKREPSALEPNLGIDLELHLRRHPSLNIASEQRLREALQIALAQTNSRIHPQPATDMGVPFEAIIPYVIMTAMFGVTGAGMATVKWFRNDGKAPRRQLDLWDRQMMERDYRLTGKFRGQTDKAEAPLGYEVNSGWKIEPRVI
ncbi:uncharacterized protein A1O9_05559 [Exophiala aquamarina CBS 119918]|uniref:NADH dehydrogenase [ubiquinone] 1 alpha subcomplex subunit 1 n=1 Tax=Exophiala aquamarina CBS 119918 TaxID=1182545 RepID=A0A072PCR6_9EURO|nr:uncharacterized protein A1O9_05559 [Exophiala aquamarina CBS 119918]KEF57641.1 hypothetical protein A1O9_05559 [Exophiala aquamarina CBS 119918]